MKPPLGHRRFQKVTRYTVIVDTTPYFIPSISCGYKTTMAKLYVNRYTAKIYI